MLKILKNIRNSFLLFFSLLIFSNSLAKEITNLSWTNKKEKLLKLIQDY